MCMGFFLRCGGENAVLCSNFSFQKKKKLIPPQTIIASEVVRSWCVMSVGEGGPPVPHPNYLSTGENSKFWERKYLMDFDKFLGEIGRCRCRLLPKHFCWGSFFLVGGEICGWGSTGHCPVHFQEPSAQCTGNVASGWRNEKQRRLHGPNSSCICFKRRKCPKNGKLSKIIDLFSHGSTKILNSLHKNWGEIGYDSIYYVF